VAIAVEAPTGEGDADAAASFACTAGTAKRRLRPEKRNPKGFEKLNM